MRTWTAACALTLAAATACGGDDEADLAHVDAGCRYVEVGECARPAGAVDLAVSPLSLGGAECLNELAGDVAIATSLAEWDALFSCPTPVPDGLDFNARRVAVVQVRCTPIDLRFTVETQDEIVVGIFQRIAGACLDAPIVLSLAPSAKPIRLARCVESGEGDCPPVP